MSSMLSKNHIKSQDLVPFLRGYDNKSPETAEEWAKGQSSGFEPGMLIFCLEKVASAPGLAVGRREEGGDNFKVRDLCIVVGEDGDRPLVVNITASAYELRFLEVLMFEKAKKAILDEKEFPFVAARPIKPLDQSQKEEIEQLGAVYAQGGSRRSLQLDVSGPQEPAMALLSALGVKLTMTGIGKQNIDIGYICLLLFTPDGRTEDKNKAQVKTAFVPMTLSEKLGSGQASGPSPTSPQAPAQGSGGAVWQDPLPPGQMRVPPGSESLLSGGQDSVTVSDADDSGAAPAWQPPAAALPEFSFSPGQPSTFASPGSDFQEQLSHKTEFEQHMSQGAAAAGGGPASGWGSPAGSDPGWAAPTSAGSADWGSPPAPPSPKAGGANEWAPAPTDPKWGSSTAPAAPTSSWGTPDANPSDWATPPVTPTPVPAAPTPAPAPAQAPQAALAPSAPAVAPGAWSQPTTKGTPASSDWGAPPAPAAASDWGAPPAPATGGDWGSPPPAPSGGDWGNPPAPMPAAGGAGDWGRSPALTNVPITPPEPAAPERSQTESGSWTQAGAAAGAAAGTTPGTGAWNTPWAQSDSAPAAAAAQPAAPSEPAEEGQTADGAPIAKKDANLFNRLYQQLAKGSPTSSMTNLPQMTQAEVLRAAEGRPLANPNASATNLPKLSQELLSRTTAPQSPNASSTNLQPMDPELAAHFRIPLPPPGTDEAIVAVQPSIPSPTVVSQPEPAPPVVNTSTTVNENPVETVATVTGDNVDVANEAPSWLESLDKKKSSPYTTTTNLKPPTINPNMNRKASASSTNLPAFGRNEFDLPPEFNLPTDADNLRETGKIKMTPSMRDAVKRKAGVDLSVPATPGRSEGKPEEVANEFEPVQEVPEAVPTPQTPSLAALLSSEATSAPAPEVISPAPAESSPTQAAEAAPAEDAAPEVALPAEIPALSKEEDPYKHLAEALSGLMNIDDDGPELSPPSTPPVAAAPAALVVEPAPIATVAEAEAEVIAEEPAAIAPAPASAATAAQPAAPKPTVAPVPPAPTSPVVRQESSLPITTPAPGQSVSSRFAAMEAAFNQSEESPFKPLSIDTAALPVEEVVPPAVESAAGDESFAADSDPSLDDESSPEELSQPSVRDTNFLVTSRTDLPAIDDSMIAKASPSDALDPSVLITSAADIPVLNEGSTASSALAAVAGTEEGAVAKPVVKPAPFQEPRLVMNEMVTLMNKLEQQVAKAAKKISGRAEEIKQRLNKQVDELILTASQVENQNQVIVQETTSKLSKSLDSSTEEARQNISDTAGNGRGAIKLLLGSNQRAVDETKNKLLEDLKKAGDDFREESEALARDCETFLGTFVQEKTDLIDATLKEISERLGDTNDAFLTKITARFERFKERMNDEASSIGRSLERNVHSMFEEIDGSWDRASEKLKLTKSEFEQTILHSVKTVELSASQNTRQILISSMAPQLRERTRRLLDLKDGLTKQFMSDTVAQSSLQLQGLESSLAAARQQLHTLVADCVSNLDGVGRGQQAGLEEIFKTASAKTEKLTSEVQLAIQDAQARVQENEVICKRLAENSSVDTDPELTEERNSTTQGIQRLKSQCNSQIQTSLEDACTRLEQMSQRVQNEATTHRMQHTQLSRDASENGLNRIREAVQEAFAAVQTAREQYME